MPTNEQLQALLDDYVTGNISAANKQLLLSWLNDPAISGQVEAILQQELASGKYEADQLPGVHARLHARLQEIIDSTTGTQMIPRQPSLLRRLTLHKGWWAAAAVIIILLGAGLFRLQQSPSKPVVVSLAEIDIPPGNNKATLTLANGSVITLDSAGNQVIQQDAATIRQQDGQLQYDAREATNFAGYNTLSTPRGGQFHVILPDGTRVWLNAASSLKYPVAFTGNERVVEVSGEAYFEVAHNASKPFRVSFSSLPAGKQGRSGTIEVLGTHFNVNAYDDEDAVRTTLLEGKVKVSSMVNARPDGSVGRGEWSIIKPGEQAIISARDHSTAPTGKYSQLTIDHSPDIDQVMAWKNGAFNFENKTLEEVMRQLSRWYDIDVVYEGKPPSVTFIGEMGRDVNLSKILVFLSESRIHFRMEEGKRLIVTN